MSSNMLLQRMLFRLHPKIRKVESQICLWRWNNIVEFYNYLLTINFESKLTIFKIHHLVDNHSIPECHTFCNSIFPWITKGARIPKWSYIEITIFSISLFVGRLLISQLSGEIYSQFMSKVIISNFGSHSILRTLSRDLFAEFSFNSDFDIYFLMRKSLFLWISVTYWIKRTASETESALSRWSLT